MIELQSVKWMFVQRKILLVMGLWKCQKKQRSIKNKKIAHSISDIDQEKASVHKEESRKRVSLYCLILALFGLFLAVIHQELILASFFDTVGFVDLFNIYVIIFYIQFSAKNLFPPQQQGIIPVNRIWHPQALTPLPLKNMCTCIYGMYMI